MAASSTKEPESSPADSLFWRIEHALVCPFYRLYTVLQRLVNVATSMVLRVMKVVVVITQTVLNIFDRTAMLMAFTADCARGVRNFDYFAFAVWLSTLPRTYYENCKVAVTKTLWEPIFDTMSNAARRISRYLKALLREYVIYVRGFAELCRRLYLLASDFVPGGQITVTAFLLFMALIFIVKLFSFIQLFSQLVEFAYGIIVFLLHPLVLTMKDILAVLDPAIQVVYLLARIVLYALISALQAVASFFWLNLVSILSGLYKCWQRILGSKVMKIVCSSLAKIFYIFLEKFVSVFLPFMTRTTCVALNFLLDIFCVAYKNFFVITIDNEKLENLTASRVASSTFIFCALILAFRLRKRFSENARSEVDDSFPDVTASARSDASKADSQRTRILYDSSRREMRIYDDTVPRYRGKADGDKGRENFPDDPGVGPGHIHFSAVAHICADFIKGSCQKGKECDNHHCLLPYQWQYRPSLEGWTSFVEEDNERIECLFCDPNNNVVTINEIHVVLKSYRTRTTTSSSLEPVKLDFENMRLEKSHQRADLRRLSTESNVKESESTFATQWLWYTGIDSGKWIKYGEQGEIDDVAQEDIESAFLRREREYTYTKNNQEFRLHLLMTPMCQRSFRPYSKKVVRRRPLFRSAEVVKKLKEAANSSNRLSIKRFFSWL